MTAIKRPPFNRKHEFRAVTHIIPGYTYGDILNTADPECKGRNPKPYIKLTLLQYYWTRFMIGKADDAWSKEAAKINKSRKRIVCRQVITEQKVLRVEKQESLAEIVAKQQAEGLSEKLAVENAAAEVEDRKSAVEEALAELEKANAGLEKADRVLADFEKAKIEKEKEDGNGEGESTGESTGNSAEVVESDGTSPDAGTPESGADSEPESNDNDTDIPVLDDYTKKELKEFADANGFEVNIRDTKAKMLDDIEAQSKNEVDENDDNE